MLSRVLRTQRRVVGSEDLQLAPECHHVLSLLHTWASSEAGTNADDEPKMSSCLFNAVSTN